jgi:hypothetical protein
VFTFQAALGLAGYRNSHPLGGYAQCSCWVNSNYFGGCTPHCCCHTILEGDHVSVMPSAWTIMRSLPVRAEDLRLYSLSIAASKDRIVSKGLSHRGRVGFDRSGSTTSRQRQAFHIN